MAEKAKSIMFKYVYPDGLRDLYVNGVWGGATPRQEIYVHFYSERHPLPKTVTHELKEDRTLGAITASETGGDVVRLIQASLVMDLRTATAVRDWLSDKINRLTAASAGPETRQ